MKKIPLTQGKFALVDDEDFDRVSKLKWHTKPVYGGWYAATWVGRGERLLMHRFIVPGVFRLDHKNKDGLDNQKENLRPATRSQYQANRRKLTLAESDFKGVSRNRSKWRAMIGVEGKRFHLGNFDDEISAAHAYDEAAIKSFGEFARLNFPVTKPVLISDSKFVPLPASGLRWENPDSCSESSPPAVSLGSWSQ